MTVRGREPPEGYAWRVLRHPRLSDRTLVRYGLRRLTLGTLELPTGRILVGDPTAYTKDLVPLAERVAPGRYPVYAYQKSFTYDSWDHFILALVELRISDAPPASHALALREGQGPETDIYDASYAVEAAAGCFCDAAAKPHLVYAEENYDPEGDDDVNLLDLAFASDEGLEHRFKSTDLNAFFFRTGDGDGSYPCYWAYDSSGAPARLITSFGIVEKEFEWEAGFPEPFRAP
ncbi:DUF4241 domain-containing protein [Jiella sp. M17.18]|uniref:DUF4241 domain-containing protein n=1 Tax=Jiella sp. M17.18 TaxID=3234247 RepID=UPI0034DF468A